MDETPPPKKETPLPEPPSPRRRILRVQDLLGGFPEITLLHAGAEYRLRITRLGKLILTK
jgi:hemin uptake protein HemP